MKLLRTWVVLVTATTLLLVSCNGGGGDGGDGGGTVDLSGIIPVLIATVVNMNGPYNVAAARYGDISFRGPIIWPFGHEEIAGHIEPAIHYWTVAGAPVYAVVDAVVVQIFSNGDDWEIIMDISGTEWHVGYDHVLNVRVAVGDTVVAGQQIGTVGVRDKVELTVWDADWVVYPPTDYNSTDVEARHDALAAEIRARDDASFRWAVRGPFASS